MARQYPAPAKNDAVHVYHGDEHEQEDDGPARARGRGRGLVSGVDDAAKEEEAGKDAKEDVKEEAAEEEAVKEDAAKEESAVKEEAADKGAASSGEERFAFVTAAFGEDYWGSALVLQHGLNTVGAKYPLLVMTEAAMPDAWRKRFESAGATVRTVTPAPVPAHVKVRAANWKLAFVKLEMWRQTDFTKLVWIDADSVILENSDDLFQHEEISAPPDFDMCHARAGRTISGLMVIRPSAETYDNLVKMLNERTDMDFGGGDQDLLNEYFPQEGRHVLPESTLAFAVRCQCSQWPHLPRIASFVLRKPWDTEYFATKKHMKCAKGAKNKECRARFWCLWKKHEAEVNDLYPLAAGQAESVDAPPTVGADDAPPMGLRVGVDGAPPELPALPVSDTDLLWDESDDKSAAKSGSAATTAGTADLLAVPDAARGNDKTAFATYVPGSTDVHAVVALRLGLDAAGSALPLIAFIFEAIHADTVDMLAGKNVFVVQAERPQMRASMTDAQREEFAGALAFALPWYTRVVWLEPHTVVQGVGQLLAAPLPSIAQAYKMCKLLAGRADARAMVVAPSAAAWGDVLAQTDDEAVVSLGAAVHAALGGDSVHILDHTVAAQSMMCTCKKRPTTASDVIFLEPGLPLPAASVCADDTGDDCTHAARCAYMRLYADAESALPGVAVEPAAMAPTTPRPAAVPVSDVAPPRSAFLVSALGGAEWWSAALTAKVALSAVSPGVPVVALVSRRMDPKWRARLEKAGFLIHEVEPLPLSPHAAPADVGALRSLDRVYAWSVIAFHRIMYIDVGSVPVRSVTPLLHADDGASAVHAPARMDKCGAPDASTHNFALFVTTPNKDTYAQLRAEVAVTSLTLAHGSDELLESYFASRGGVATLPPDAFAEAAQCQCNFARVHGGAALYKFARVAPWLPWEAAVGTCGGVAVPTAPPCMRDAYCQWTQYRDQADSRYKL